MGFHTLKISCSIGRCKVYAVILARPLAILRAMTLRPPFVALLLTCKGKLIKMISRDIYSLYFSILVKANNHIKILENFLSSSILQEGLEQLTKKRLF